AEPLGLELKELYEAPCTGAGVLSEQNPQLADALNGLTLAMAESEGADLMTICSTCQGVLSNHNYHLKEDKERMDRANATLAGQGFQYGGTTKVKHLLWMLFEDIGIDRVKAAIKRKLTGLKIAPFYGCYILRPEESLGLKERPERKTYLEQLIALVGAEPVEYRGSTKCCGFPMLTFNRDKALAMGGNHIMEAKDKGADLLVTPCPLCHLNLDGQQPDASRVLKKDIDVPIFHLPQLLGLAFGMDPAELRLDHHVVPTKGALEKVELKV
ncbi:MAG: CoB--CoM heterodisulfide reductase iron-sulfur subunit B family protein, partial [Candidatus Cybelea sp.]